MARTANRRGDVVAPDKRWNLGQYIRLSKEDFNKGFADDSNSVKNQKEILDAYYQKHSAEFDSVITYIDDGCTGTDSDRENFQKMLNDIIAGKINCVVIKDLSRLSRNYSEAGGYIDYFFVKNNVRFICLAEPVIDSYRDPSSVQSIAVPMYNVFNDMFAKQTSEKVRQVFDNKRSQGYFISGFAPYGYMIDPSQKGHLVVDEEVAPIVQKIFDMFCDGLGKRAIASHLNDLGILAPISYKQSKGIHLRGRKVTTTHDLWQYRTLHTMLKNQVYIGDMVQGRQRVVSYKVHEKKEVPKEEWFIVEGTHEPIISKEQFEKVQSLLERDTRSCPATNKVHLFAGFIRCADCNAAMSRHTGGKARDRNGKQYVDYLCGTYKHKSTKGCASHRIRHDALADAVMSNIQKQIDLAVQMQELIEDINAAPVVKKRSHSVQNTIQAKHNELQRVKNFKRGIIQEKIEGNITPQEYQEMLADYNAQEAAINTALENLMEELKAADMGENGKNPVLDKFIEHQGFEELNRDILTALVDCIYVHSGGEIEIHYKFADHFKKLAEFIEINGRRIAADAEKMLESVS